MLGSRHCGHIKDKKLNEYAFLMKVHIVEEDIKTGGTSYISYSEGGGSPYSGGGYTGAGSYGGYSGDGGQGYSGEGHTEEIVEDYRVSCKKVDDKRCGGDTKTADRK
eukprot:468872_1